jgi:hypothetical protein
MLLLFLALLATLSCACHPGRADPAAVEKTKKTEKVQKSLPAEAAIRRALAKPVKLDLKGTPLFGVISHLEDELGIQIRLDRKAMDDVGAETDDPVTLQVAGISARSALDLMLRQFDLTWVIRNEVLLITTPEEAESFLVTKVYDVADLVCCGDEDLHGHEHVGSLCDFDSLIELITSCLQPTTWDDVGGPCSVCSLEAAGIKVLVFSQTQDVHEDVEQLLADLRAARRKDGPEEDTAKPKEGGKPASNKASNRDTKAASREEAIRRALHKSVTLEFVEAPLPDVLQFLKDKMGIQIVIDQRALDDVGIGADTLVTIQIAGVKLRSALDLMLRQLDLTWVVYREVLLITSPEEEECMLRTRVYDISDLPAYRNQQGQGVPDYDSLIKLIRCCIGPVTWNQLGGPGSIDSYEAPGIQVLVVSQTARIHEEVEGLLVNLRKVRGQWSPQQDLQKLPEEPKPMQRPPVPQPNGLERGGGMF